MLPQKETRFSWYFNSNGFFKIVRDACEVYIHQVAGIDTMLLVLARASRLIQWRLTAVSCREARRIYCHFRTAVCVLPNSLTYSVSPGYSSSLIYRRSRPSRWFHCVLTVPVVAISFFCTDSVVLQSRVFVPVLSEFPIWFTAAVGSRVSRRNVLP